MRFLAKILNGIIEAFTPTREGEIGWNSTDKEIQYHDGTAVRKVVNQTAFPYLTKKITGNAGGASAVTSVAHGLTLSKIVSISVWITYNSSLQRMSPGVNLSGFLFYVYADGTNIFLDLQGASSLASQPYIILITYER